MTGWTFLTNHGAVLVCIAMHPHISAALIASTLRVTERTVRRIIADLQKDQYILKSRVGRTNLYQIREDMPLRRPQTANVQVGELLGILLQDKQNPESGVIDNSSQAETLKA
jgi:hypothetical protein